MAGRTRKWGAMLASAATALTGLTLTALTPSAQAASPAVSHAQKQHRTVATAPAGSAIRRPYVAAAKREAARPRHAPTGRWARAKTPVPVCGVPQPGHATCLSLARTAGESFVAAASSSASSSVNSPSDPDFSGYLPDDIQAAYGTAGMTQSPLVAIVDFNDDPGAEADLAQYRRTLALPACTTANGCFTKVDQQGGTSYPPVDPTGDATAEISLDLDAVSAACPTCHMLLVEADSSSFDDMFTAVDEATTLGAAYVSMSWGDSEGDLVTANGLSTARQVVRSLDAAGLAEPGVTYVAATGDDAFRYDATTEPMGGLDYPASSSHVVAAGGVALDRDATTGAFSQTSWSWDPTSVGCQYTTSGERCAGAGSGCSTLEPAESWQQSTAALSAVCSTGRAGADASADADPNTGLLVDDGGEAVVVGGTSLATPLLTSLYALTGETAGSSTGSVQTYAYAHPANLLDVTSGTTGSCGNALCTSGASWDGPTGLGMPDAPTDLFLPATPTVTATWPIFRYGTASTVRVTVKAATAPTGTIALKSGATTVATGALTGTGTTRTAALAVPGTRLTAGAHPLTVSYAGSSTVAAKTLAAHTVTVAKATPTVTAGWPSAATYGKAFVVSVAVKATAAPSASGTVAARSGAKTLTSAHLPAGSATTKTVRLTVHTSALKAGRRPLTVAYAGDPNIAATTLGAHAVTVRKATPTLTVKWPAKSKVHRTAAFKVRVKVAASGTLSRGKVTLKSGAKVLRSVRVPAGAATRTITIKVPARRLAKGRHSLTLVYSGDANVARRTKSHPVRVV